MIFFYLHALGATLLICEWMFDCSVAWCLMKKWNACQKEYHQHLREHGRKSSEQTTSLTI